MAAAHKLTTSENISDRTSWLVWTLISLSSFSNVSSYSHHTNNNLPKGIYLSHIYSKIKFVDLSEIHTCVKAKTKLQLLYIKTSYLQSLKYIFSKFYLLSLKVSAFSKRPILCWKLMICCLRVFLEEE